jgi:hypothetical protein
MKRTPLKRKTRLRPVSTKRRKALKVYSSLRSEFLDKFKVCIVCVDKASTDIHHMDGRHNARLNNTLLWLPVCRRCHDLIHANPSWARENGYLV